MFDMETRSIPATDRAVTSRVRDRPIPLEGYEIGSYPVTQEQLGEVLGMTASHPRRPATDVTWFRAVLFCNALSEWEGHDPAYSLNGSEVTWFPDADGYRLPTEHEWEHACRAGSTSAQYAPLREAAWTSLDGVSTPQDVGGRLPNLHGLFDMLGNVWEWCWNGFDPDDEEGGGRAIRGGSYHDDRWSARADSRRAVAPQQGQGDVGFRVARGAVDPGAVVQGWVSPRRRGR